MPTFLNQHGLKGEIIVKYHNGTPWYHLPDCPADHLHQRLADQLPTYSETCSDKFTKRLGQTLEIAVQRGLETASIDFFGRFTDLDSHDDGALYSKEEPPSHLAGRTLPGKQKLDFLVRAPGSGRFWAGIEVKNTRPWIYPRDAELLELLRKCVTLDIVPVLIARRIPYVTGFLLRRCGLITWETLRQRYPTADAELASRSKDKRILGFSDISLGNQPDGPLSKFLGINLPMVIPEARERFNDHKDLLAAYAFGEMPYDEFAARVRRRAANQNEDFDLVEDDWLEPP